MVEMAAQVLPLTIQELARPTQAVAGVAHIKAAQQVLAAQAAEVLP